MVESGSNGVAIFDLDAKQAQQAAVDIEDWFVQHGQANKGEIKAIGLGVDVSNEDNVKEACQKVIEQFGRIDVMITAAGIVENFAAQDYPTEKFRKLMSINVGACPSLSLWWWWCFRSLTSRLRADGSFFCAREAAKDMLRRNAPGSIVLIGPLSSSSPWC